MIKAADLFCGAGGTSLGAEQTGEVKVSFAVNHWDTAIQTHSANFPNAKHVQTELRWVRPTEADPINILFASPECTHHSRARGGRPTTDQQRAGAWELMPWIEHHRPSYVVVENVVEFADWGPVDQKTGTPLKSMKGRFFEAWIAAIQSAGYRVDYQRLNAADFGAATSRERLFVVARKGRRSIHWPDATHSRSNDRQLPGFEQKPWRGAIEIIDWSLPLPSVFGRKRPLADKTLARIQKGLERHLEPFVVQLRNNMVGRSCNEPIGTVTAGGGHHGISVPYVVKFDNGSSQAVPKGVSDPIGTVTTKNGQGIAAAFFVPRHGEREGQQPRTHSLSQPTPTIACSNSPSLAVPMIMAPQSGGAVKTADSPVPPVTTLAGSQLIVPWLTSFYGTQNSSGSKQPCPTITTVDRHALTGAMLCGELPKPRTVAERKLQAKMIELGVADIGFRMLSNEELAAAQGFSLNYKFCGTKKDVTKQIGNSVSPPVARAITEALLG